MSGLWIDERIRQRKYEEGKKHRDYYPLLNRSIQGQKDFLANPKLRSNQRLSDYAMTSIEVNKTLGNTPFGKFSSKGIDTKTIVYDELRTAHYNYNIPHNRLSSVFQIASKDIISND